MSESKQAMPVRLTAEVSCAGCAAKLAANSLSEALAGLKKQNHPDLLVGYNTADDAGVFRINETQALVQTVDFFPPIVDDPYSFGQIAAANALSDVYAMGGRPVTAMNIVAFPSDKFSLEILTEILRGGGDKITESGAVLVGGHTIKDPEIKYGVSVTGLIDPRRIITNANAKPGDKLYLTKPLGTGIVTTAVKRDKAPVELEAIAIKQMSQLNDVASQIMVQNTANSATDITGFGLLGHTSEMAIASGVTIRIISSNLPLLPQVLELASEGMNPGGAKANREYVAGKVVISDDVSPAMEHVLYDPQTSGGLLIAMPQSRVEDFERDCMTHKLSIWHIGMVETKGEFALVVE